MVAKGPVNEPVDEYEGFDFAINTALIEALEALEVAFEQYEALEDSPQTRIEINGYGVEMLDDLSMALHRNYRSSLGYRFEQPGLRTASELVQSAAGALGEFAVGAEDSETYLAELCNDLLVVAVAPATAAELTSIAHACMTGPTGTGWVHGDTSEECGTPGSSAA